jgi:amidophosphoribosyltransferase
MKEYCGVSGIIGNFDDIFYKLYLTLFALQHRGQESAGISLNDKDHFFTYKRSGFARNLLDIPNVQRKGAMGIGHVRYSTSGNSNIANAQPVYANTNHGKISLAHNGNLVNYKKLRNHLKAAGAIFQGNSDSEMIMHYLAHREGDFLAALTSTLHTIRGAYSIVLMDEDALYGIRDPYGFRPLVYGKIDGGYIITSETCAIDILNGEYLGEVTEGNILRIDKSGNIEFIPFTKEIIKQNCVFEHIYFARPDSCIFGKNVHKTRYRMGEELARENPDIRPDIVVAVPDSGLSAAMGFADESNVPLDRGLIRNHYVGRSFIYPTQEERKNIVRMKLQPVFEVIKGKDIALIDDSMVRGTTAKEIIGLLKQKGVGKIHYFLACPPIKYSCYFGIDTPNRKKLIANNLLPKEIAEYLEIESVNFLSINGLKRVLKGNANDYCYACFAGNYIMEIEND